MRGMFVSLDGVDGAGKSTQVKLLIEWLQNRGREVVSIRDPGGTKLGEALREILLHRQEIPLAMTAEMLLYMASRAQLVSEIIRPALQDNKVVVADRYLLANVVYQGHAGGLPTESIWAVGSIATAGLTPNLTCVLDLPVEVAMQRLTGGLDRLESRGREYMEKVRRGFLLEASALADSAIVVDATLDVDSIHTQIVASIEKSLYTKS